MSALTIPGDQVLPCRPCFLDLKMMMRRKFWWRSLILASLISVGIVGFQRVNAAPVISVGLRNEYTVLQYLWPTLKQSGKAGRIYFEESCPSAEMVSNPFPSINVHTPSKGAVGLAAVREIFEGDMDVAVEENPAGIIKVRIGKIATDFLQTKISLITFSPIEQYNDRLALDAIWSSREMQAAMTRIDRTRGKSIPSTGIITLPGDGLPHLPATLRNTTLDQSLDLAAKTFGRIVVFGICPSERWYTVYFAGDPN